MRRFLLLALLGCVLTVSAPTHGEDSCVGCHQKLEEEVLSSPVTAIQQDVHSRHGLSCAGCHGGDPSVGLEEDDPSMAMDPEKGYIGKPSPTQIPQFCGKCHSDAAYIRRFNPSLRVDQLSLYWTSVHGRQLSKGDEKVAECVSCHGSHGILPASDPRSTVYPTNVPATCAKCHEDPAHMEAYKIPMDQSEKYVRSVHGQALLEQGDLGAPACNDCHGNHGATPPGVSSVANVCGQCHSANSEMLAASPHRKPFEEMEIPACESCHEHHEVQKATDQMLGSGEESVCTSCHEPDSKGHLTSVAMKSLIENLKTRHETSAALIFRAERAGMEVSDAKYDLNEAEGKLILARAVVHTFSSVEVEKVVSEGIQLADTVAEEGRHALAELQFRRKGLGVSLIIIAVVAVALFSKIKDLDRKRGIGK